jgi:membrane protease YdiL (CAAX protease family)
MVSNSNTRDSAFSSSSNAAPTTAEPRSRWAAVTIVGVIVALGWHYVSPQPWTWLVLLAFVPVAIVSRNFSAMHLALLAALTMAVPRLFPTYPSLVMGKTAVLVAYGGLCFAVQPLRQSVTWLGIGTISRRTWLTAAIFIVGFALFTAWYLTHYRPPAPRSLVSDAGISLFLFIVFGAAINALAEEVFWRGTMQSALTAIGAPAGITVVIQAAHFGLAHYRGPFFAGWAGVMGSALMGGLLGNFRRRTGTLFLSWLVHFVVDAVLFAISAQLLAR